MTRALLRSTIDGERHDYLLDPVLREARRAETSDGIARLLSRFIATRMTRAAYHDGENAVTVWLRDQGGDIQELARLLEAMPSAIEDPRVLMEIAHLRALAVGLIPASEHLLRTMEAKAHAAQSALQALVMAWVRGLMPGTKVEFRPDRGAGRPRTKPVDVADLRCAGRFKEVAQALEYRCCILEDVHRDPFVLRPNVGESPEAFVARVALDLVQWVWENTSLSWMPKFKRQKLKRALAKAIVRRAINKRSPRVSLIGIAYGLLAARERTNAKAIQSALERAERGIDTRHPLKVSTPRYWRNRLRDHV
jgi:hypothetical protein